MLPFCFLGKKDNGTSKWKRVEAAMCFYISLTEYTANVSGINKN